MTYKISIIIPLHNMEKYISQTLDSLLNQTMGSENMEVIMVDDCSNDGSAQIIDNYANKHDNFIPIHLTENSGLPGKPRNIGLEKATGEYLMFMDHDDCYTSDALETFYNKITTEGADVIFSRYNYYFENGRITQNPNLFGKKKEIIVDNIAEEERLLSTAPAIWAKMFKRSFIMNNNIRFPEGMLAEDLSFVTQAFLKARGIIYLNYYFSYYYRIRDSDADKSTIRIRNKKYLKTMIDGYYHTYNILKKSRKEEYITIIFKDHLKFWLNCFMYTNATAEDKKKLLYDVSSLFKKIISYNVDFDEYSALANSISHGQFNSALRISELMLYYQKREDKLRRHHKKNEDKLRRQINAKKSQVAELQTLSGYSKYKTNNMIHRLKKRFKG